nr:MAG TPA: hypothetical protein [Crassvirales sp.]
MSHETQCEMRMQVVYRKHLLLPTVYRCVRSKLKWVTSESV